MRHSLRFFLALLLLIAATGAPAPAGAQDPGDTLAEPPYVAGQNAPRSTISWYMETANPDTLYNLGCRQGNRDQYIDGVEHRMLILHFFAPDYYGSGIYGATLFNGPGATVYEIERAVEQFGKAYYDCIRYQRSGEKPPDLESSIKIGIGTTNYRFYQGAYTGANGLKDRIPSWYGHGQAWADMVDRVHAYFVRPDPNSNVSYAGQVTAEGADDIEIGFGPQEDARQWVDGYESANTRAYLHYGALDGCPVGRSLSSADTCASNNDFGRTHSWNIPDVWYAAAGPPSARAIPEIYDNGGSNADQWYRLSKWGAVNRSGDDVWFQGEMTQYGACNQPEVGCDAAADNTPLEGWNQLNDEVNADTDTASSLQWSTDIKWHRYYCPECYQ